MALVLRNVKGSRLTFTELDGNFTYLEGLDLSGVTYNIGSQLLTLTRNNGGTLTTTIPSGGGTDIFVTGGTANVATSTVTFTNSTGGTFNIVNGAALFADNDINVTGGTYSQYTGCVTFGTNSGTTFNICGFVTGMTDTYVTGGTLNGSYELILGRTIAGDVPPIDLSALIFSGNTSGTCISDLWVTNIHGCSPVTIETSIQSPGSTASGTHSLAYGNNLTVSGDNAHGEGDGNTASGDNSHAEGYLTEATDFAAHAEGWLASATGQYSHAEGYNCSADGNGSHAEGNNTIASTGGDHAEGSTTTASGGAAHSEGQGTLASGQYSHAEGQSTIASTSSSHAQGFSTQASGYASHAGGRAYGNVPFVGYNRITAAGDTSFIHFRKTLTGGTTGAYGDYSAILGGINQNINTGAHSSGIFVGSANTINTNIERTVVLGGANITGTTNDTVYVPNLNIDYTPTNDNTLTQILTRDTDGTVKYRDASSISGGAFTGNTSGTCISDIFVTNIHSCSPLNINPLDEGNIYFGSTSGVTINVTDESVTAQDLYVGEYIYHEGDTNTFLRFTPDRIRVEAGSTEYICIQDDPPGPATGEIAFNEGGSQINTRIESVGLENLFFVNGQSGYDSIGINSTGRTDAILHVNGDTRIDGRTTTENFTMTSGATLDYVLTSDANGNGRWAASSGGAMSFTVEGDNGTPFTITSGDTLEFVGLTGIDIGVSDPEVRVAIDYDGLDSFIMAAADGTGEIIDRANDKLVIYDNNAAEVKYINVDQLSFTGNTSGTCISDIWVSNIHSCSPLSINPGDEGNVFMGSSSGFTFNVGTERLGIGTAGGTNYKLWIKETSGHVQGKLQSTDGYARWIIDSEDGNDSILQFNENVTTRWQIGVDGVEDNLIFTRSNIVNGPSAYSASTALSINSNDFVGVGTVDAQTLLHIKAEEGTDAVVRIESDADNTGGESDNPRIEFVQDGGILESGIGHNISGDALDPNVLELANSTAVAGGILFSTNNINGFGNAIGRMFIEPGGDIGIGTQAPQELLHVSGNTSTQIKVTGGLNAGLIIDGAENSFVEYKEDASRKWIVGNHQSDDHFKWATGTTFNADTVMELGRDGKLIVTGFQHAIGASSGYVFTSDGSGNASWAAPSGGSFTGNTSGTCIQELWVTTISGCSPVTIGSSVQSDTSTASGAHSFAYGWGNIASGIASHAEGGSYEGASTPTSATTDSAHAEGIGTLASGMGSHAEGFGSVANAEAAHAEGSSTASATMSHAEGSNTIASGVNSHSEGQNTIASAEVAHAEGDSTVASGNTSHAQGLWTIAGGNYSHAGGKGLNGTNKVIAQGEASFAHYELTGAILHGAYGNDSAILGGADQLVMHNCSYSAIIGGKDNVVGDQQTPGSINSSPGVWNTVVIGGSNITGLTSNTVYVPQLNVGSVRTTTSINNLGVDADGFVTTGTTGGGGGGAEVLNDLTDAKVAASDIADRFSIWIANGTSAGSAAVTGTLNNARSNLGIGSGALEAITEGDGNIGLGYNAGTSLTTESWNIAIGYSAGGAAGGSNNVFVGDYAGSGSVGLSNTVLGSGAKTAAAGNYTTFLGATAGINATGNYSLGLGYQAGGGFTGLGNIGIGKAAGYAAHSGNYSILIGYGVSPSSNTASTELTIGSNQGGYILRGSFPTLGTSKLMVNPGAADTPTATLHVKGQGTTDGTTSFLVQNSNSDDLLTITDDGSTKVLLSDFYITQVPSAATLATNADGKIVDPASDIRLKKNILNLQHLNPLEFIKALKGYEFEWRAESNMDWVPGRKHYGFLANQVKGIQVNAATNIDHQHYMEKDSNVTGGNASYTNRVGVGNNMVYETSTKFRHRDSQTVPQQVEGVNYIDMIPWLVEALKELSGNVDNIDSSVSGALEKFLQEGRYDASTEEIILTLNNNDIVRFPVSALLDNTNNYVITGTSVNNILTLTRQGLPDIIIPIDGLKGDKGDIGNTGARGADGSNKKYAADISFVANTTKTITHSLNDEDVIVQIKDNGGNLIIAESVNNYQLNKVDITVSISGTYRVIIIG